ncbi:MAG: hypothetical protein ACJATI_004074 [Halioglobus sp.]|jgi:hypothetical protein
MFYKSNGEKISLEESPNRLIIRTKGNFNPELILSRGLAEFGDIKYIGSPITFPEASVFVFHLDQFKKNVL